MIRRVCFGLMVLGVMGLPVFSVAASGSDQPSTVYLVLDAESGTLEGTTLTLTGLPVYMLAVRTPEFFAAGMPRHMFLQAWQFAGDAPDPVSAMLQVDTTTVTLTVTLRDYHMDEVQFTVEVNEVVDFLSEEPDLAPPAAFGTTRLVLQVDEA